MFECAHAIWLKNRRDIPNLQVGFRCDFEGDSAGEYVLRLTASTYYRVYLNGRFAGYGPARAGHGYMRYDEIPLSVSEGINKLAVEVAGYNCSGYYSLPVRSFLMAEIARDGSVIKYTGRDFKALSLEGLRNIKALRYSLQRTYSEVWNFDAALDECSWQTSDNLTYDITHTFDICEKIIPRNLPLPLYNIADVTERCERGVIHHKPFSVKDVQYAVPSNRRDGYLYSEISEIPLQELYGDFECINSNCGAPVVENIKSNEYVIFKLPCNNTGFLMNCVKAVKDSSVYIFFAEHNFGAGMIFDAACRMVNVVKYNLKQSDRSYSLESFEPYTCKYIGIAVVEGEIYAEPPRMREYSYPEYQSCSFDSADGEMNMIFSAAKETFRQNTLDVFMDCPGRERGGWLCDSYFTARTEKLLTGKNAVEMNFVENFVMAEEFPNIPAGMLPMVYPSQCKNPDGLYIPQWAMWFVVELGELYCTREVFGVHKYKSICYGLLQWFEKYENDDGLLEKMPGWNFVEWSMANDWVQDVNYPTNMLYCKMLAVMGQIFDDEALTKKSNVLKQKIIEQAFDGELFADNGVREKDGTLRVTDNHSETCQYYAYFTGIADAHMPQFEKLTDTVINTFGPQRKKNNKMSDIAFANSFIGNYLRLIILLDNKEFDKVYDDIKEYFLPMAEITGTLWENDDLEKGKSGHSLNHGFASFAGVAAVYATCGIRNIDYNARVIDIDMDYLCRYDYSVNIATADGNIAVRQTNGKKQISLPYNWRI